MSSIIFNNKLPIRSATYDKRLTMDKKQADDLPDFVKRVREEKKLSLLDVERDSARRGNKIAGSYVSRIENRIVDPKGVSTKKLQALALGLDVPEEQVFGRARGQKANGNVDFEKSEYSQMWADAQGLTPQQKRDWSIAWQMAKDMMQRIKGG
jgi:transcriptional regulator with XRE-family HTH domain